MTVVQEDVDLRDFKAWSGGEDTLKKLIEYDTVDKAQREIEEMYPKGITDTELNDWLWFELEDAHPEWFDDNKEEKDRIRAEIEATHHTEGPLGFLVLMESEDGELYRLNYEDDDDDFTVFKLVAEAEWHSNGGGGWSSEYEVDYDFSKTLDENIEALKAEMFEDGIRPALADGMEYVEGVPEWSLSLFANGDYTGYSREDVYNAEAWQYENGYGLFVVAYEETREEFDKYPAFGLPCATELAVFDKEKDPVYLIVDDRTDKYVFEDFDQGTDDRDGVPLLHFYSEDEAKKFVEGLEGEWKEHLWYRKVYDPKGKPE